MMKIKHFFTNEGKCEFIKQLEERGCRYTCILITRQDNDGEIYNYYEVMYNE